MVGCNSSENVAGTEWDLQVIVVLKVGFGPGHVAKRPILEKQWGPGQVIKTLRLEVERVIVVIFELMWSGKWVWYLGMSLKGS